MKPAPFEYHRPVTATEAAEMLAAHGEAAKVLAGGQSLVPMLALRLAYFDHLVDVSRLEDIQGIEARNGSLWVGAGTVDSMLEKEELVRTAASLLAMATPLVGHFRIRNRGTVGGSLAHADPAAEYPAVALALDDNPHPAEDQIREGLSGNLCRCTGYQGIIAAVRRAATEEVDAQ